MRKPTLKHLFAAGLFAAMTTLAASAHAWPMWDSFKAANIDKSYRVIDYSDERAITTSEGQSYAMFFALVADDRETFDKLLEWTEKNLAKGDITKNLPSWLWGKTNQGWGIIDSNNATDSDLWIAYDLLEAARIWNVPEYAAKAHALPVPALHAVSIRRTTRSLMNTKKGTANAKNKAVSSTQGASKSASWSTPAAQAYSMRHEKNSNAVPTCSTTNSAKYSNDFFITCCKCSEISRTCKILRGKMPLVSAFSLSGACPVSTLVFASL